MLAEYGTDCDLFCFPVYKSQKLLTLVCTFISQIHLFGKLLEGKPNMVIIVSAVDWVLTEHFSLSEDMGGQMPI